MIWSFEKSFQLYPSKKKFHEFVAVRENKFSNTYLEPREDKRDLPTSAKYTNMKIIEHIHAHYDNGR